MDLLACPKKWTYEKYALLAGVWWGGDWNSYKDNVFTCNYPINEHLGALSRSDNATTICSHCGVLEGLEALRERTGQGAK